MSRAFLFQAPSKGVPYGTIMEKVIKNLMLGTAIALALGSAASAQDMFRTEMDPVTIPASDFIGKRVYAAETALDAGEYAGVQDGWNDIGEINDVILGRDGRVDFVLVDIGGFLGIGEKPVAIDLTALRVMKAEGSDDLRVYVQMTQDQLETLPEASM